MADQRTLEDRTRSADIRRWAEDNGFSIAQRGKLPRGIIAAYEAANSEGFPGGAADGGPDWSATEVDPGVTTDPLADIEDVAESEGPPPPASLDEARERAGTGRKRGKPAWAGNAGTGTGLKPPVKVTASVQRDIEGKLALMLAVPVGAWEMADPYCGGAMAQAMPETIKAAVPLICQSPGAVAFFTRGATWMLWLGLASALRPVGIAVYQHHLSPEAQKARRERELAAGNGQVARQEPQQDLSAYTTIVSGHVPQPRPA